MPTIAAAVIAVPDGPGHCAPPLLLEPPLLVLEPLLLEPPLLEPLLLLLLLLLLDVEPLAPELELDVDEFLLSSSGWSGSSPPQATEATTQPAKKEAKSARIRRL